MIEIYTKRITKKVEEIEEIIKNKCDQAIVDDIKDKLELIVYSAKNIEETVDNKKEKE